MEDLAKVQHWTFQHTFSFTSYILPKPGSEKWHELFVHTHTWIWKVTWNFFVRTYSHEIFVHTHIHTHTQTWVWKVTWNFCVHTHTHTLCWLYSFYWLFAGWNGSVMVIETDCPDSIMTHWSLDSNTEVGYVPNDFHQSGLVHIFIYESQNATSVESNSWHDWCDCFLATV